MGIFDFEAFQLKDWGRKIKENPEQLLIGAGDPLSAKMWSGITGKEYEPFVDQMGGPYGGSTFSVGGDTDGGVYGRAEDAGINTKPARNAHNVAHAVAAIYAGGYGAGQLGGGGGGSSLLGQGSGASGAGSNLGVFSNGGVNGMSSVGNGMAGVTPNIQGGAGAFGGNLGGMTNMASQFSGQMGGQQPQQDQQASQPKPYWVNGKIVWV